MSKPMPVAVSWFYSDYVRQVTKSGLAKKFGITPKQAAEIIDGNWQHFLSEIEFLNDSQPRDVSKSVNALIESSSLSNAKTALALGVNLDTLKKMKGAADCNSIMAFYFDVLAAHQEGGSKASGAVINDVLERLNSGHC